MADRPPSTLGQKLLSWMPFVLPVIGGSLGMGLVQAYPMAFINPVIAVLGGALAGWTISALIFRLIEYR